ncbi:hypothetical protein K3D86_002394 [Escherichia coli]|nr:hypothetical protein [Escherichia coli]EHW3039761.1 hypothetical protein [Escherichia coli]
MKERGMIFNGEMVRAILDGRKTQTRRIVNSSTDNSLRLREQYPHKHYNINCPFGQPGDRIWVRETWGVVSHELDEDGRIQPWTPDRPATAIHEMPFGNGYYSGHAIYAADGEFTWGDDDGYEDGRSCWKPSIHMPRWASRILLEITDVRVERLNNISECDAKSEGGPTECTLIGDKYFPGFRSLWKSIYGEESWAANPWVWVIEFKRIEGGAA